MQDDYNTKSFQKSAVEQGQLKPATQVKGAAGLHKDGATPKAKAKAKAKPKPPAQPAPAGSQQPKKSEYEEIKARMNAALNDANKHKQKAESLQKQLD
eukprot:210699-Karenia_brevis.AAC.1